VRRTDKIVRSSITNRRKDGWDTSLLYIVSIRKLVAYQWNHTPENIGKKREWKEREERRVRRSKRGKELEGRTEKGRRKEDKFVKEREGRRGRRKKEMDRRKGKDGERMGKKEKEGGRS
jgi:hypothetical protein